MSSSQQRPCTCGECPDCLREMHNDEIRARNESYMSAEEIESRRIAGLGY